MEKLKVNTVEEAIHDFREGKFVIVVDDEDRENEGDLICAAEKITPEMVNFMLKYARGVLCAPVTISRSIELDLPHQVQDNTSLLGTPFTVTIDKIEGCSTGVSAHDRAATIKALADPNATPQTFGRPGHVNPLYAQDNGVLRRCGHTEAAIDLCHMAGLYPAGALMEIMNDDGTMARLPELIAFEGYHHQRHDSLPPAKRIYHRSRRRGRYAHRIRTFPTHPIPPKQQWAGTHGTHQRRMERRRTCTRTRTLIMHDWRYPRFHAMRLWRTTSQSHASH